MRLALVARNHLMPSRRLVALPVFNEARHVDRVLDEVLRSIADGGLRGRDVLVVDDGSTDGTAEILRQRVVSDGGLRGVRVVTHEQNRGYGAALLTAFQYSQDHDFELLVTIDCDGQHEPQRIPLFFEACTPEVD